MSSSAHYEVAVTAANQVFDSANASVKSVHLVARAVKEFNPLIGLAHAIGDDFEEEICDGTARLLVGHLLELDSLAGHVLGEAVAAELRSEPCKKKVKAYMTFVHKNRHIFQALAPALSRRSNHEEEASLKYPSFPPKGGVEDASSDLASLRTSNLGLQDYRKDYHGPPSAHAIGSLGGSSSTHRHRFNQSVFLSKPEDDVSVVLDFIKAGYSGRSIPPFDIPSASILRRIIRDFSVHALPPLDSLCPEYYDENRPAEKFDLFRSVLHALTSFYGLSVEDKLLMCVPSTKETTTEDEVPGYERSEKYPDDTLRVGCTVHSRGQFFRIIDRASRDLPDDLEDIDRYCQAVWHFLNQELICQGHTFVTVVKSFEVQFPGSVADWCSRSVPSHSFRAAPQRPPEEVGRGGSSRNLPRAAASQAKTTQCRLRQPPIEYSPYPSPTPSPVRPRPVRKRAVVVDVDSPAPVRRKSARLSPDISPDLARRARRAPSPSPERKSILKKEKKALPIADHYKSEWGGDPDSTYVCFAESDYLRGKRDDPCPKGKKCTYSHDHVMIRAHNELYQAKLSGSNPKRTRA